MKAILFLLWLLAASAFAADTVTFTPSASIGVTNYTLSYGPTNRASTNRIQIGTNTSHVVSGLLPGAVSFLFATAWSSNGVESVPSNEVTYTNRNFPPTIQIMMILEKATDPAGPYQETTNKLEYIAAVEPNTFYRVRLEAK